MLPGGGVSLHSTCTNSVTLNIPTTGVEMNTRYSETRKRICTML